VRVTDEENSTFEKTLTITINNVNEAPVILSVPDAFPNPTTLQQ